MKWALIISSAAVHGGLLVGLGTIEARRLPEATAISVVENEPPPPAETPPPPPPVKEPEAPRARRKTQAPAPTNDPVPEAAKDSPLDALPDLGFELGGVAGGAEGFAVRAASPQQNRSGAQPARRVLSAAAPKRALDPCQESPAKAKLISLPKPSYTNLARQNGVEGKVRVSITVDDTGRVVSASVLESLGHGLDEAALAAAQAAQFEAAVRCGKPASSTFTIAMRFSAG